MTGTRYGFFKRQKFYVKLKKYYLHKTESDLRRYLCNCNISRLKFDTILRLLKKYRSPLLLSNDGYVSGMHAGT